VIVSGPAAKAFDDIARREQDVLRAYDPGAAAQFSDVAQNVAPSFTVDPLSVVAPANALFVSSGQGGPAFSRDGTFRLHDGTLVDGAARAVLGYANGSDTLVPLRADAVDVALGFANSASIESDGSVWYARATIDPRNGARENSRITIGRLALARFPAGTQLQSRDGTHLAGPVGVAPHFGRPGDGNFALLAAHARASSGIDLDRGLERLQEAYLAFDALRAANTAQDSLDKTSMDLLK